MSALDEALQDIIIDRDDGTPNYLACCLADVEFGVVKHREGCSTVLARQELSALRAEVERLKNGRDAKIEKIKAVLRFVEWHGNRDGWECCPYCYGLDKHDDNCELAAALNAPSEGQKRE